MVPAARGRGEVGRCGAARELVAKSSLAPLPSPAADGSVATRRGRRPWACVPHPQVSRTAPAKGAPPRIDECSLWLAGRSGGPTAAPRRSPLSLQGERRVRVSEGVFSHPRSTSLPQPRKCVEGTRSHTCAPDEGTPPRRGAGPAEWICTGKQPPRTRARRPTLGPPGLQLGSPTRARTQERPLGARRWRSPLFASGQYVAATCARGGGPLGLSWP